MSATVLITGNSSGLGLGLTQAHLERGDRVLGLSRRGCPLRHDRLQDHRCDLAGLDALPATLAGILGAAGPVDVVYLNAGLLGPIQDLRDTDLDTLRGLMDVNLWANKLILDALIEQDTPVDQVVLISSGAAVNGNRGWGGYALSKSALNMLAQLYAHEMPGSHLVALAPGLVDTAMQDFLCGEVDSGQFPSIRKLIEARGSERMPGPREAADHIVSLLPDLRARFASGAFVDVRQI